MNKDFFKNFKNKSWLLRSTLLLLFAYIIVNISIVMLSPTFALNDPDTFWHIELGRWMIDNQTIVSTGIHSFYGDDALPYVQHEILFQLIVGFIYKYLGWNGLYGLVLVSYFFTVWGLLSSAKLMRNENNIKSFSPIIFIFILVVSELIFLFFLKVRPQLISTPIILWFMIWMRYFQIKPSWKKSIILILLSLLLANIHGGVWAMIVVFFIMIIIESVWYKKLKIIHIITFILIVISGFINFGGIDAILYIKTTNGSIFTDWIAEWMPLNFRKHVYFFIVTAIFVWCASITIHKKNIFYSMFALGILYLGIANPKQHLYLLLFITYFFAIAIEEIPYLNRFREVKELNIKTFMLIIFVTISINSTIYFNKPYEEPIDSYPVEEMNYILKQENEHERPKVLSTYNSSGYVMFRGGNILADGRFDPFINEKTKDERGWIAIQRSHYAYLGELNYVINQDKPDYVIVPHIKLNNNLSPNLIYMQKEIEKLGTPSFSGTYGNVWRIQHK